MSILLISMLPRDIRWTFSIGIVETATVWISLDSRLLRAGLSALSDLSSIFVRVEVKYQQQQMELQYLSLS